MQHTFKELRTELAVNKLSQAKLSELTGIPKRTIEDYEGGKMDLMKAKFENIIKLADAMGLSLDDFR